MKGQLIISVGREFGSGGHEIAEMLAKHYGIQLLDHNLLDEIAAGRHLDIKGLREFDEKKKNPLVSRTVRGFSSSPEENLHLLQFDYLKKKAAAGESFVIVGRCSESILKDYDCLVSVFVLGEEGKKTERIMERYHMTEEEAKKLIREKNMKRKKYHNGFCQLKWGDSRNYDISINSSRLGTEGTMEVLVDFIDRSRLEMGN